MHTTNSEINHAKLKQLFHVLTTCYDCPLATEYHGEIIDSLAKAISPELEGWPLVQPSGNEQDPVIGMRYLAALYHDSIDIESYESFVKNRATTALQWGSISSVIPDRVKRKLTAFYDRVYLDREALTGNQALDKWLSIRLHNRTREPHDARRLFLDCITTRSLYDACNPAIAIMNNLDKLATMVTNSSYDIKLLVDYFFNGSSDVDRFKVCVMMSRLRKVYHESPFIRDILGEPNVNLINDTVLGLAKFQQ